MPVEPIERGARGRAWLMASAWVIGLAGVIWIGLSGRGTDTAAVADAGVAELRSALPTDASPATSSLAAPVVSHRTFGEDGLVGGIVFGDNVPALNQRDVTIRRQGMR